AHEQTLIARPLPHALEPHQRMSQCLPPSVLTSTRAIRPRPLHASPEIAHQPGPVNRSGYAGDVISDLASISKLNMRALPPGSGSVYFDVSQRVMNGSVPSFRRRSHFTLVLPSQPGSSRRIGKPC